MTNYRKVSGFHQIKKSLDIDPSSFNKSVNVDVTVQGDLYRILIAINKELEKKLFFKKKNKEMVDTD